MGADFRPIDTLYWDEKLHMDGNEYMHESHFVFVNTQTGEKEPLYNDEARKEFPNLSFLFSRFEQGLYEEMLQKPEPVQSAMREVYQKIEDYLKEICDDMREKIRNNEKISIEFKPKGEVEEYMEYTYKWFRGELVQHFHYCEPNNEIFEDHIRDTIEKCLAEKDIKQAEEDKEQDNMDNREDI